MRYWATTAVCVMAWVVFVSMLIVVSASGASGNALGIPQSEYDALVALYYSTGGPNWTNNTNWLTENTRWYRVTIESGHVTGISLYDNGLSGAIPLEIGSLTNLRYLNLSRNQLTGPIPPEIGNLSNLHVLDLYCNQLSGSIPPEIGNLTNLLDLVLYCNQLSGSVPPEIGNLTSLDDLFLFDNQLTGSIPPEIGNLVKLRWLGLWLNKLTGPIPPEIANLTSLHYLWLDANQLSGSIPPEIGDLANLFDLALSYNQLSGSIPPEIGNLATLEGLDLSYNQLDGSIPSEIGNLVNLQWLGLRSNTLRGDVPDTIINLVNLAPGWTTSIAYNGLASSHPDVIPFLAEKMPGWEDTQTVPPAGVFAATSDTGAASVSWTPILYQQDAGYYEVGFASSSEGPFTFLPQNRTEDKYASALNVTGLPTSGDVYVVMRTTTLAHESNQSDVTSLPSLPVLVAPTPAPGMPKLAADYAPGATTPAVATVVFGDDFYIEDPNRAWGIRVWKQDHGVFEGQMVEVSGTIRTAESGERYIEASSVSVTGSGTVAPLGLRGKALGGGNWSYDYATGAGQRGVTGGSGLNNIGLLVKTWGKFAYVDAASFKIDDGSGVVVTCQVPDGVVASSTWQSVEVTGISSCETTGGSCDRLLRAMSVKALSSVPNVTGRWEMMITTGDVSGVHGMLLTQQGSDVYGTFRGNLIENGQMSEAVFTCRSTIDGNVCELELTQDGEVLSGTLTNVTRGWVFPATFHRLSLEPVSPYVGRPQVLAATCDGTAIDITWDRPVSGWDFVISRPGEYLGGWIWADKNGFSYDLGSNTFHLALLPDTPLTSGLVYTVIMDSGDGVGWHDPYGAPAWDSPADAYSFQFTAP